MDRNIIFIFGCQRSGTTATINGLGKLENVKIFKEVGDVVHRKSEENVRIRLKSLPKIKEIIQQYPDKKIIIKPLVESQHAVRMLKFFPNSIGLWLYRDYKSVVHSMLEKWNENVGFTLLRYMADNNVKNWRSQLTDKQQRALAKEMLKLGLSPEDAASLFWYFRNQHFYRQKLQYHERISLIHYSSLVSDANYLDVQLKKMDFEIDVAGDFYHKRSLKKEIKTSLNPIIESMCDGMFNRLNESHFNGL